jgi:hypothetical protein
VLEAFTKHRVVKTLQAEQIVCDVFNCNCRLKNKAIPVNRQWRPIEL